VTSARHHLSGTLAVASIAAFMASIDMMVVTTALPALRRSLGGNVLALEWTVNAYLLAFACLLLTASGLGDRFGRRRVFTIGLAGFALSSVAAALAPGIGTLVAARAAQGATAALILPLTLTMVSEAFPPQSRGRAIGIWGGVTGLGGVLGPILGAGMVQAFGWSWIFWINAPIALALIPAALRFVTETFGARQQLDVLGLVLASLGFLAISWGPVQASAHSVASAAVLVPVAAGLALVSCFLVWERKTRHPMLPLSMFRSARFNVTNTVGFCIYGSLCGAVFLTSQYFQIAQHHSPIAAALRFIPWPIPTIVIAPLVGSLAAKYGNQRFMAAGMAIQALALAWFARGSPCPHPIRRTVPGAGAQRHRHRHGLSDLLERGCFLGASGPDGHRLRYQREHPRARRCLRRRTRRTGLRQPNGVHHDQRLRHRLRPRDLGLRGIHGTRRRRVDSRAANGYCPAANCRASHRCGRESSPHTNDHQSQRDRR
jgi:EmrB/QacA subfamily drug resistance transporter